MSNQPGEHTPPIRRTLQYGDTTIAYTLGYAARDTLAIHVHPDTRVTVEAPLEADLAQIEEKVRQRAAWILRQQRNFRRFSLAFPPRRYVSGESHRYLGRQYRLQVAQSEDGQEAVRLDRERLLVQLRPGSDAGRAQKLVENWYRKQARRIFGERLAAWAPRFARFEVAIPRLVVRQMSARWGSCSAGGQITLNLKLVYAPKQLIDYVIVHELCHLVVPRHDAEFYGLLGRLMPDWEAKREALNGFEF